MHFFQLPQTHSGTSGNETFTNCFMLWIWNMARLLSFV